MLDEIMDNGYPQTTDSQILSQFIKPEKENDIFNDLNKIIKKMSKN